MELNLSPDWKLSADHAASNCGKPVLVNRATGRAYGPGDFVRIFPRWKHLHHAAPAVRLLAKRATLDDEGKKLVAKLLEFWPEGRRVPRVRRKREG